MAPCNHIVPTYSSYGILFSWFNLVVLDAMVLNYSLPQASHLQLGKFVFFLVIYIIIIFLIYALLILLLLHLVLVNMLDI